MASLAVIQGSNIIHLPYELLQAFMCVFSTDD